MLAPELENLFELASSLSKEEATDGSPASIISDILRLGKDETKQDMPAAGEDGWLAMPFLHDMHADIQAKWDLADFDPKGSCDKPNINLTVMGLILATNIESTVGDHAWSLVEFSLDRLGFDNITHHYFETDHLIDHPAMAFGVSRQTVAGKHVVAAVYRGSSSFEDFISDVKAEPYGFHEAGINACD